MINRDIKKKPSDFEDFLVKFNVIGLALATMVGLALSNSTQMFIDQLLLPIIELFSADFKEIQISIFSLNLNIGIIIIELIKLIFIVFIVFLGYEFINIYMNELLQKEKNDNKNLEKKTDTNIIIQKNILKELKILNNKYFHNIK